MLSVFDAVFITCFETCREINADNAPRSVDLEKKYGVRAYEVEEAFNALWRAAGKSNQSSASTL